MRSFSIFILVVCLVLSGCVSTLRVQPVAGPDQTTIFKDGTEVVISKKRSVVAVRLSANTHTSEQRPKFVISVLNGSDKPAVFSTEDITASVAGSPLKVFSCDELIAEVENQRKHAAMMVALSGAAQLMNAPQAGNQYHSGSYNTRYSDSRGNYGSGYGTYSGTTYNPGAVEQARSTANAQMAQNFENINSSANGALSTLGRTILKKETVFPNEWHGGYVIIQRTPIPDLSNTISLKVLFCEEEHAFEFTQTKVK